MIQYTPKLKRSTALNASKIIRGTINSPCMHQSFFGGGGAGGTGGHDGKTNGGGGIRGAKEEARLW